jgi:hypothetical protein
MNDVLNATTMLEATRLTRAGRLVEATTLLQRRLRGETTPDMAFGTPKEIAPTRREPPIIDAKAEAFNETDGPLLRAFKSAQPHFRRSKHRFGLGLPGLMQPAAVPTPDIVPEGGKFIESAYSNPAGAVLTSSTSRAPIAGRRSL